MIRVPFYPGEYTGDKPDERELYEVDPIYKVHQKDIVKIKVGAPAILEDLLYPEMREEYKKTLQQAKKK